MRLVVINGSPRAVKASNTDKIAAKWMEGFESEGNSAEYYALSRRNSWEEIRKAYEKADHILFALPLYVECVPGIMMEFLETLEPKQYPEGKGKTKMSFLLQGGFAEASQLRCGERYLEMLPGYLNCVYNGTLIKGNQFAVSMMEGKMREKILAPFYEMGKTFAKDGCFQKQKVTEFAKPEYFSKGKIAFLTLIRPLQKMMFNAISKKMGATVPIEAKPYEKYVK